MIGAIAGAVAGLAGSVIGGIQSANYMKKANRLIQQQRDENKAWYDTKMSQDYTERVDVQSAINKQRELLDQQYKQARATNVVAGGSDQALAMQQQAANDSMAQTMSSIAENAAAYKDNVENQYRSADAALNQQQVQNYQQKAAAAAQAGSQAANAGIGLLGNLIKVKS